MATKNFATMTTKKLNALLETANEDDKLAIQAVLDARAQASASAAAPAETTEASAETTEAPAEAAPAAPTSDSKKLSDEELHALAEECKKNINHRCQVVPFNTIQWVDGTIVSVIEEKRSNKVIYAIKTDDGRRVAKVYNSELIKIFDEVVEPVRAARGTRVKAAKDPWTDEAINEAVNEVIGNVGKTVKFEKFRTTDENGEEEIHFIEGRVVAIVPDKRTQRLLYRIAVPAPVEGNPLAVKIMHKVCSAEGLEFSVEFDEEGVKLNESYCRRRENAATRVPVTPQDRVLKCEENLKKAEEKLQKAQEDLEAKKQQLEAAKAELDAYLASQGVTETEAENTEEELA